MPEFTPAEVERWRRTQGPDKAIPGTAYPMPGKCGRPIRNKGMKLAAIETKRYCGQPAGYGTPHLGRGPCKYSGGCLPNVVRKYAREEMVAEIRTLAEKLEEGIPVTEPEIMMARLARKIANWEHVATGKLNELEAFTTVDQAGVERVRALIEIFERAIDRSKDTYLQMMKYNLKERVLDLELAQANAVASIMLAVIMSPQLQLTDEQVTIARLLLRSNVEKMAPQLQPAWAKELERGQVIDVEPVTIEPETEILAETLDMAVEV